MTLENAALKAANHGYAKYKQVWKRIHQLAWGPDPKQFTRRHCNWELWLLWGNIVLQWCFLHPMHQHVCMCMSVYIHILMNLEILQAWTCKKVILKSIWPLEMHLCNFTGSHTGVISFCYCPGCFLTFQSNSRRNPRWSWASTCFFLPLHYTLAAEK